MIGSKNVSKGAFLSPQIADPIGDWLKKCIKKSKSSEKSHDLYTKKGSFMREEFLRKGLVMKSLVAKASKRTFRAHNAPQAPHPPNCRFVFLFCVVLAEKGSTDFCREMARFRRAPPPAGSGPRAFCGYIRCMWVYDTRHILWGVYR